MPFGLCNAPGTFQRCMMAIFHDMIEKTMEVFMDDFSVFGSSFSTCLTHLEKMLKRCEDTNLALNWEKSHFMVKEGIVLGHKISKSGIEVDRAKIDVIAKLPHPTTVKVPHGLLTIETPCGNFVIQWMSNQQKREILSKSEALFWKYPFLFKIYAVLFKLFDVVGVVFGQGSPWTSSMACHDGPTGGLSLVQLHSKGKSLILDSLARHLQSMPMVMLNYGVTIDSPLLPATKMDKFEVSKSGLEEHSLRKSIGDNRTDEPKRKPKTKQNQARNGKDKVKGHPSEENTT
ncbi:reverse transcriptase domain-containing protein [Tanacetum coccineum]|uniref:Reverse transcriptase domain-containing protein n=1 Tax=Tanacetum coccineum TaxID=301880 RepID=A0ABQ5DFV9_9ASTR